MGDAQTRLKLLTDHLHQEFPEFELDTFRIPRQRSYGLRLDRGMACMAVQVAEEFLEKTPSNRLVPTLQEWGLTTALLEGDPGKCVLVTLAGLRHRRFGDD
jgi:hypothetical protein